MYNIIILWSLSKPSVSIILFIYFFFFFFEALLFSNRFEFVTKLRGRYRYFSYTLHMHSLP